MTNEDSVFEAWVNIPHKVLGKTLRPLSLNHLLFLYNIESPLVLTDKETTMADLEIAVLICSSNTLESIVKELKRKHRLWRQANRLRGLKAALHQFITYSDDYCSLPKFHERNGENTEEVIPWMLNHAATLIKATGWSEETVFQMPLGKIVWFNTTFSYFETGKSNVQSDKESAAIEMLRQLTGGGA